MKTILLFFTLIGYAGLLKAQEISQADIDNWVKQADEALNSKSYNTAFNLFEKAADAGDAYAIYRIGWMYYKGDGITKNYERAAEWYQKAVEAGNAKAMNGLGHLYTNGFGVEQDYERALQLFKQAVAFGNDIALYNIALFYESGWGITKDLQKAVSYYRMAAEKDDADAMNKMASFYRDGKGVEKDLKQAEDWYQKAADKGNADAIYQLAVFYQNGAGVKKDTEKARALYQQASDKGHSGAKKALDSMNIIAEQKQQTPGGLLFSAEGHINGYNSNVRFITYSQNGKYMATASDDFTAIIWDAASGKMLRSLHTGSQVRYAVFSPDGKAVATASLRNAIIVWDRATGKRLLEITTASQPETVSFSPDSKRIVTQTWHNHPEVWDIASQKLLFQLKGHTKSVSQAVYSHDGKYIATVSVDQNTIIWDAHSGERLHTIRGAEEPPEGYTNNSLATVSPGFSPDGKKLAFGSGYLAKICDVTNGNILQVLQGDGFIHSVAFSPDGKTVVTGGRNVKVWNVNSGKLVRTLLLEKPNGVLISPDGKMIAGYTDDFIVLWDAASGTQLRKIKVDGGYMKDVFSLAFSPDAATISAGTDTGGQLWNTHSGKKIRNLGGRERKINALFIPGSNTLALSAERQTKIFDAATDKLLFSLKGDFHAFSPDGKTLATVIDSTAYLWDAASGSLRHTLAGHWGNIEMITFGPRNKTVSVSPVRGKNELWDIATGQLLTTIQSYPDYETNSFAFSPDGKQVITTGDGFFSAEVRDAKTGEGVFSLKSDYNVDMGFGNYTPDGKSIITGTISFGQIIKWDAKTGERISVIHKNQEGQDYTKFGSFNDYSPDGKKMVINFTLDKKNSSGNEKKINKVFDIQTGKPLFTLEGESNSVDFSPDGKYLFGFDGREKTAKIWDAATGRLLHTLRGHQYSINHIACSPDSKYIMTAALNGSLILWDAATGKKILKQFIYDNFERVTVANNGLFDATAGAKNKVYAVRDPGIAGCEQLIREGYEEPNLWSKIMKGEKLRELVRKK
jgi:WD40 repeat protein/TPR repeat protein